MFAGAGLEALALLQGQDKASGFSASSSSQTTLSATHITQTSTYSQSTEKRAQDATTSLVDQISLSERAQEQLRAGQKALRALESAKDILSGNIKGQLENLRKDIEAVQSALTDGSTSEIGELLRETGQIGQALQHIGKKLGLIGTGKGSAVTSAQSLSVTSVSLTASFNSVAQITNEDGSVTTIEQSQDVELSYVQVAYSETRNSAVRDFEFPKDVRDDFLLTAKGFMDLISEFEEFVSSEDRFPPSLSQVIRDILGSTLEKSAEHLVDQAA